MRPERLASAKKLVPYHLQNCLKAKSRRSAVLIDLKILNGNDISKTKDSIFRNITSFFAAEFTDTIFPTHERFSEISTSAIIPSTTSSFPGALHSQVASFHGCNLVKLSNSASWLPIFTILHRRRSLNLSECRTLHKRFPTCTFQCALPWTCGSPSAKLCDEHSITRHAERIERSGCSQYSIITPDLTVKSLCDESTAHSKTMLYSIHDLCTARPDCWKVILSHVDAHQTPLLAQSVQEGLSSCTLSLPLKVLQNWHDVFFSLSLNPSFSGFPDLFKKAHLGLQFLIVEFYKVAEKLQEHLTLPPFSKKKDSLKRNISGGAFEIVMCTRMPPLLVRRWKKLYDDQHALMQYVDLFRTIVSGEEAVVRVMKQQQRIEGAKEASDLGLTKSQELYKHCVFTTALLQEEGLWQHFLSIPGRRRAGLTWEEQWEHAKKVAFFYFDWHFQHLLNICRRVDAFREDFPGDQSLLKDIRKACSVFMNICMWVRNDNDEGQRCVEACRCILGAFFNSLEALDYDLSNPFITQKSQFFSFIIIMIQRTAVEAMFTKSERVHFAASSGLFDVCTVVTALQLLREDTLWETQMTELGAELVKEDNKAKHIGLSHRATARDLDILLSCTKKNASELWHAMITHPKAGVASRFAILTLGKRLCVKLLQAKISSQRLPRVIQDLFLWAEKIGGPLGLTSFKVESMWYSLLKLEQIDLKLNGGLSTFSSWASHWVSILSSRLAEDLQIASSEPCKSEGFTRSKGWTCGCGFTIQMMQTSERPVNRDDTACIACVCRTLVPESWQCPSCHFISLTGEKTLYCLNCGAVHPSLPDLSRNGTDLQFHSQDPDRRITSESLCDHRHVLLVSDCVSSNYSSIPFQLFHCVDCGSLIKLSPMKTVHSGFIYCTEPPPRSVMLFCCYRYNQYQIISTQYRYHTSNIKTLCCSKSDSTRAHGYVRGYFVWVCGCGVANSPTHSYCWLCSRMAAKRLASVVPSYQCPNCQNVIPITHSSRKEWHLAEGVGYGVNSLAVGPCSYCGCPHPRDTHAVLRGRLISCPTCYTRLPVGSSKCNVCSNQIVEIASSLLETEADMPWRCYVCGNVHPVRALSGECLPRLSPLTGGCGDANRREACKRCGTTRFPPSEWEPGRPWVCAKCNKTNYYFLSCKACGEVAPWLPRGEELYLWRCGTCQNTINYNWCELCALPGCGGFREGAVDRIAYSCEMSSLCRVANISSESSTQGLKCRRNSLPANSKKTQYPSREKISERFPVDSFLYRDVNSRLIKQPLSYVLKNPTSEAAVSQNSSTWSIHSSDMHFAHATPASPVYPSCINSYKTGSNNLVESKLSPTFTCP